MYNTVHCCVTDKVLNILQVLVSFIYFHADLEIETRKSYRPPVTVVPVKYVQYFKPVVQEAMAGSYGNHSKPLLFRSRNADGKSYMHYKMWVTDEWRPATDSEYPHGLACLKVLVF